jgi:putative peptide zinc metalloprotease protein
MNTSLAVLAGIVAAICLVPLPYRVVCALEVQPRDAHNVYVHVPGTLQDVLVKPGDKVAKGQVLARLQNVELDVSIEKLKSQQEMYERQLRSLDTKAFDDQSAMARVKATRELLASTKEQLGKKLYDQRLLELKAPRDGFVMPPHEKPQPPAAMADEQLPSWHGTPLLDHNLGCQLEEGELFCQVGLPDQWRADMVIDQNDTEFVHRGQQVEILLTSLPEMLFTSKVSDIAAEKLQVASKQLSNKSGGELPTKTDEAGQERPMSATYEAWADLDDSAHLLRLGLTGTAKIHAGTQTLGQRLWRYVTRTFHFQM